MCRSMRRILEPRRCSSTPEMALMSRMCSRGCGGHAHQNWAFTAPGVLRSMQASGTLVGASEAIQRK